MSLISTLMDYYFQLMKSINVRSLSIVIIVIIVLIEFVEMFVKPENIDSPDQNASLIKKEEKSNFLRRMVNIENKEKNKVGGEGKNEYKKDDRNNYYVKENLKNSQNITVSSEEDLEVLGSKVIEINTIIDGNRLYMERREKAV